MPQSPQRLFDRLRGGRGSAVSAVDDAGMRALRFVTNFEDHGDGWFWQTDRHGCLTYISAKVAAVLATDPVTVIGRPLTDLFQMDGGMPHTERTLAFHLTSRTSFQQYTVFPSGQADADLWWSISGRPVLDELGNFDGFVGSGSDLTAKRRAEAEITKLALFDGLTGLANRQRMRQSLDQTLLQASIGYRPTALFLLDLDRFKSVNDTLGHQVGDALLKLVAQRLLRCVGERGLVGRLGGDEFEVIIPSATQADELSALARDIIESVSQPYFISGSSITIGVSVGIAVAPDQGQDAESLTRNADLALYAAKSAGRGLHRFFDEAMLQGAQTRKQLEDDLRHALAQGQMHVVYQPVVSTRSAAISGYEALVRWTHPQRGPISPADFIPIAEECGLIEQIGEWVLRTACAEAAGWPGNVRVAVNVSPVQFANPNLPTVVASVLSSTQLEPHRLELEITEGVFLNASAQSERLFATLKGIGVRLALDDFGTGYASFGYLSKAPIDKIKIDQSFVRGAAVAGNRNAAIIKAIVTLANTLDLETTAEGVEIQDEIALIKELGCSHIQGYVYGKPMSAADAAAMLASSPRVEAIGYKVSRPPRTTILRSVSIQIEGRTREARLRNISIGGAMIDAIDAPGTKAGDLVHVMVGEGGWLLARISWKDGQRVGITWDKPFDMTLLNTQARRLERRS